MHLYVYNYMRGILCLVKIRCNKRDRAFDRTVFQLAS